MKKRIIFGLFFVLLVSSFLIIEQKTLFTEAKNIELQLMDFSDIKYDENVEAYDYMELMEKTDYELFINWLNSLKYDLKNDIECNYIKDNLNKFILKSN